MHRTGKAGTRGGVVARKFRSPRVVVEVRKVDLAGGSRWG